MIFAVYELNTGKIARFVTCDYFQAEYQLHAGEGFFLNCPSTATHIIDNEPITVTTHPTTEELLIKIRATRNSKLAACDWTQLEDAPFDANKKHEWKVYRQKLRDMPGTCDPASPVWPPPPTL